MTESLRVYRFDAPDEVSAARWDAAAGPGLYLSHRWLSSMHDRRSARRAAYLLVERAGRPVSVAVLLRAERPGFVLQEPVGLLFDAELRDADRAELSGEQDGRLSALLDQLRPELAGCYPVAVCVAPVGLTAGTAGVSDPELAGALVAAADEVAEQWQVRSRAMLYVEGSGPLDGALAAAGYRPATVGARAVLPVRWPDLAGYLASFPSLKRKVLRKELAAYDGCGVRTEVVPGDQLEPLLGQLAALGAKVQDKYGNGYDEAASRDTLEFLLARCPDLTAAVLARSDTDILAFHLFYRYGDGLYSAITGQDHSELARRSFAHFRVLYYEPVRIAAAEGRQLVDYGMGPRLDQLARGGTARPLTCWFRFEALPAQPVAELLDLVSGAQRARLARLPGQT
ncbi:MAG: GNAT family N-acetyltransferase [Jatrophihabitans sp.]